MRVYIAGPMRGHVLFNFPAFDSARDYLTGIGHGYVPISPADLDRKEGFDPESLPEDLEPTNWNDSKLPKGWSAQDLLARDLKVLETCDAIYLLKDWDRSPGALAEHEKARALKLNIYFEDPIYPSVRIPRNRVETSQKPNVLEDAMALVTGDRNAAYGPPNQDFQRTADMWTGLLKHKLQKGAMFEPKDVAWMMMLLKASRAQHSKKKDNYVDAAGYAYCGWRCEEES